MEEVQDIIEELTTTGKKDLDVIYLKKLKALCKKSDETVKQAYNILMDQLAKKHAEIRYSALLVIAEIFSRSHLFRKLISNNLYTIFLLTVETDSRYPLPLPLNVGKKVKVLALRTVSDWNKNYATCYRRIALGFEYLQDVQKVNFALIESTVNEEERKEREKKGREAKRVKSKLEQVNMQIYDSYDDIMKNIKEMENCFQLFLPKVDEISTKVDEISTKVDEISTKVDEISTKVDEISTDRSTHQIECRCKEEECNCKDCANVVLAQNCKNCRKENCKNCRKENGRRKFDPFIGVETGIPANYNLTIDIATCVTIVEDESNTHVVTRMSELHNELTQQESIIKRWLRTLVKHNNYSTEKVQRVLKLRNSLNSVSSKYLEMKMVRMPRTDGGDDDDFVDVAEKVAVADGKSVNARCTTFQGVATSEIAKSSKRGTKADTSKPNNGDSSKSTCHAVGHTADITTTTFSKRMSHNIDQPPQRPFTNTESVNEKSLQLTRKERLMQIAPKVSFDTDLEFWGKEVKPIASIKLDSLHRFWKTSEHVEEFVPPDVVESMKTRVMSFPVKFEPVKRACRALLASGEICTRMDRHKCPFHGKIVDRDEKGLPTDPEELEKELKVKPEHMECSQNHMPTVPGMEPYVKRNKLHNVKTETPKDKSKARYARLTDIRKKKTDANTRLEKKVFNQVAIRKVNDNLNSQIKKKQLDKFGDNINYY